MPARDAEELVAEIGKDAESERGRILAAGLKRAREIQAATEAQGKRLAEENARRLEARLAMERERIDGGLRIQGNRRRLEAMRESLAMSFDRARERLLGLSASGEYGRALARLVSEALEAVGDAGEVLVAAADGEACRALLAKLGIEATVRAEGAEPGQAVVTSRDGERTVDNSISTRLERLRVLREEEVARVLFRGVAS